MTLICHDILFTKKERFSAIQKKDRLNNIDLRDASASKNDKYEVWPNHGIDTGTALCAESEVRKPVQRSSHAVALKFRVFSPFEKC